MLKLITYDIYCVTILSLLKSGENAVNVVPLLFEIGGIRWMRYNAPRSPSYV